mgnify:CR=1 FL=1
MHLLLEQQPGWRVAGEAADAPALLELLGCGCPDVVLVDCTLPGMSAPELLAAIRRACPGRWIALMSSNDELRMAALQAGADVFACKADPPEKLLALIRAVAAAGAPFFR